MKAALVFSVGLFGASLAVAIASLFLPVVPPAKIFATAASLAGLSALLQLEVAGLFRTIFEVYGDLEEYPYGPPSHVTREIIDNPDAPFRTSVRNYLYFRPQTGLWFGISGIMLSIVAAWL